MAKQLIAVDDAAPGACVDVGITYNGVDTLASTSNLTVSGTTTLSSLSVTGNTNIAGDFSINTNKVQIDDVTGDITTAGKLQCGDDASFGVNATIDASSGNIATEGTITAVGTITSGSTLTVGGAAGFGGTLVAAGHGSKVIPLTTLMTGYTTDDTSDITATLADGQNGQIKIIKLIFKDTYKLYIIPANFGDGTNILLDATGEVAVLVFVDTAWHLVYTNGTLDG